LKGKEGLKKDAGKNFYSGLGSTGEGENAKKGDFARTINIGKKRGDGGWLVKEITPADDRILNFKQRGGRKSQKEKRGRGQNVTLIGGSPGR